MKPTTAPTLPRPFHAGELSIQRRAGVEEIAARVGRHIQPSISPEQAEFLSRRPFVIAAGQDVTGRVWASLIVGVEGFARVLDERCLLLAAAPAAEDALGSAFESPRCIGVLAIEFATRTRVRVNGSARRVPDGIVAEVEEVFGNCRKFITPRVHGEGFPELSPIGSRTGDALDPAQARMVSDADTFFIASVHSGRGADASHRGGPPGFVRVAPGGGRLCFPDYTGNRMFQTLGNLALDPRVGLLFPDWQTGSVLQLTGRARVVWREDDVQPWPGAERVVEVEVDRVIEHQRAMPPDWTLI